MDPATLVYIGIGLLAIAGFVLPIDDTSNFLLNESLNETFCLQGGNCTVTQLTVLGNSTNLTINDITLNITESITLNDTIISDWSELNESLNFDSTYLRLDTTNNPLTGDLYIDKSLIGDTTLVLNSKINYDSCINLTEANAYGFQICNDGSGANMFEVNNFETGQSYFTIDRDSGVINFYNESVFHQNVTLEIVNVTGTLNVQSINATYLYNTGSASGIDMRGDPWYLGGAGFTVASGYDICVDGGYCLNSIDDYFVNIDGDTMTGNLSVLASVGIGTTTPQAILDVNGSANINGNLTVSNHVNYGASFTRMNPDGSLDDVMVMT